MNKIDDTTLDELLKKVKDSAPAGDENFSSTDEFKAMFFKKACTAGRPRRGFWFTVRVLGSTAAVFVVLAIGYIINEQSDVCCYMGDYSYATDEIEFQEITCEGILSEEDSIDTSPAELVAMHRSNAVEPVASPVILRGIYGSTRAPGARGQLVPKDGGFPTAVGGSFMLNASPPPANPAYGNTEEYKSVTPNAFLSAKEKSLSTFGADVDNASYSLARSYVMDCRQLPPASAIRIEEFVNYFNYDYEAPHGDDKFGATFEMTDCPWAKEHKLLLIGLQAKNIKKDNLPRSNFVFLVDNSGSMHSSMDLVIEAMTALARQLRPDDTISLVTYGGGVNTLLDGASGTKKEEIISTLSKLTSWGYTPGSAGIQTAYGLARKHFVKNGNNRVVLITDGDFNVGTSSEGELVSMIEKERASEVYLSVFGVGYGNYKDNKLKMLANKGNGNYSFLDNKREAKKVMINEFAGGMFAIARDVKLQVEFNPGTVHSYRLLGYELRALENRDFRDDTKDAGEVGVGHQVTALYELVMQDAPAETKKAAVPEEHELKYQETTEKSSDDILTFRLRYREIEGDAPATEKEFVLAKEAAASANIEWASCAAEYALLLQDSPYKGSASFDAIRARAVKAIGEDKDSDRAEFLTLVNYSSEFEARSSEF